MDMTEITLAGLGLILPATGYLIRRVIETDRTVAVHTSRFEAIGNQAAASEKVADERHIDLKSRLARIEDKLDQTKIALENGGARA